MNIGFVTTTLDETKGWGRYAAGFLAEARRRNGVSGVMSPNPEVLRSRDVRWHQPLDALIDAWKLRKEFRDCEVIHAGIEPAVPLVFFLSYLLHKPYVISVCGTYADLGTYSWPVRWLYRLAFRRAGRVAALSRYTQEVFERGVPEARTAIVHGGFAPPASEVKKEKINPIRRIFSVGEVKARKGFHTLVEALGLLEKKGFNFRADFVGPKDENGYVRALGSRLKELGLEDHVTFHGRVSELSLNRFYDEADLFVLPSEHDGTGFEGLGLVYLEALARGLPVIGCLESGAEDVIQEGLNGRLVPPGQPEKLADAIEAILGNEKTWKQMSAAAPASVERFRWETVGADMDDVYNDAIVTYAR